jgi:hypothetical protein
MLPPRTRIGFTGSRFVLLKEDRHRQQKQRLIVDSRLDELVSSDVGMAVAITGACVGIDQYIAEYLLCKHPDVRQIIVVPGDAKLVSGLFLDRMQQHSSIVTILHMPPGSSYRDRNKRIVFLSDMVEAFWDGRKRSGTLMTINIARKAGKLQKVTMI